MAGNPAFLGRAIAKAQGLSIESTFCQALTEYIASASDIVWDDARALFWARGPDGKWQVAIWLMPIALQFHPRGKN